MSNKTDIDAHFDSDVSPEIVNNGHASPETYPVPNPAGPARILFVDDDSLTLGLLTKGLRRVGYMVDEASSAKQALALVADRNYDLGILDIHMPEMSGIELAAALQKIKKMPVLFLSGETGLRTVERATAEHPMGYVTKPVDAPRLVPSVEAALSSARELEEKQQACDLLTEQLRKKRTINTAVGVLMARTHSRREDADHALRKLARDNHKKMEDVAASIVNAAETLHAAESLVR